VHAVECEFEFRGREEIERAYVDILGLVVDQQEPWQYDELREAVESLAEREEPAFATTGADADDVFQFEHPGWTPIHDAVLSHLKSEGRVAEDADGLDISEPEFEEQSVVPLFEPMQSVFEYGPIDGCKDYAVYSMVSWSEMVDLSWGQTQALVVYWLRESGRWESESWGERSPAALVRDKQHVYDESLGWGEYPEMAKVEMDSSGAERRLDAYEEASALDRDLLKTMDV